MGARWPGPECGNKLPLYDHREERTLRHLDRMRFRPILHARLPRVECPTHGALQAKARGRSHMADSPLSS